MYKFFDRLGRITAIPLLVAAGVVATLCASAQAGPRVVLVEENDALVKNRDYGYTQGARASLVFDDMSPGSLTNRAFDLVGGFLFTAGAPGGPARRQFEWIVVGQSIFTPFNKTLSPPDPLDRPYAGWLYTGASLAQESGGRQLDTFEILAGVVGPSALGKQVQDAFHNVMGQTQPVGWPFQLKDEPALLVSWDRRWKMGYDLGSGFGFDVIPSVGLTAGNVYTYASAGAMVRFGRSLSTSWGPTRVRPAPSGGSFISPNEYAPWLGFAIFGGFEGRAVARNIFLDGNTFVKNGPHVTKNILVGDLVVGAELFTQSGARLSYTLTKRSSEFKNPPGGSDLFGSIEGSFRF
jgi:hypothetical protein